MTAPLRKLIHELIAAERAHARAGATDAHLDDLARSCIRASQRLNAALTDLDEETRQP